MYSKEHVMEVLEAFDLTKSYRAAALLCGVDHHTVAAKVAARTAGLAPGTGTVRPSVAEPFVDKIVEWVAQSQGLVRGDVVHDKLVAMGFAGSERTTRRVLSAAKVQWRRGTHRIYRPWVPEPGLWLQWDYGDGPVIDGAKTVLFIAWLAWSRFRVILALRDRTMPSVIAGLDTTFRLIGGVPTYALTDNERTVTDRHVAGIAVRNKTMVDVSAWYGLTIATCVPYDPESKGGSESSVRVAKADLVPTGHNLLPAYRTFVELEAACTSVMAVVNGRVHRETNARPVDRLEIERPLLHPIRNGWVHRGVRGVAGGVVVVHGVVAQRPVLGPARVRGHSGVGPRRRGRSGRDRDRCQGTDRVVPSRARGRGRRLRRRRPLSAATRPAATPAPGHEARRGGVLTHRHGRCPVAHRSSRHRYPVHRTQDG